MNIEQSINAIYPLPDVGYWIGVGICLGVFLRVCTFLITFLFASDIRKTAKTLNIAFFMVFGACYLALLVGAFVVVRSERRDAIQTLEAMLASPTQKPTVTQKLDLHNRPVLLVEFRTQVGTAFGSPVESRFHFSASEEQARAIEAQILQPKGITLR